jgi:nitrile hydratase
MHDHDHDHEHSHADAHAPITDGHGSSHYEKRATAIIALLIEKGLISADEVRRTIEQMDERTPALGAKVVARAWVDPAFKARLLTDAKSACAEVGVDAGTLAQIVAIENTDACTMSSSVRCAPATHVPFSVSHRIGIRASVIVHVW